MFKIPNWEDDVPKSNVDFGKTSKKLKGSKSVEPVKSPQKSSNQPTKAVTKFKKLKQKNDLSSNTNSGLQIKVNSANFNKQSNKNSNDFKNKQKPKQQFQKTNTELKQQKPHDKNVPSTDNKLMLNGNSKQSNVSGKLENTAAVKSKKKSKKRKANGQVLNSANKIQMEQDNAEDYIDISNPSKPKKKKLINGLELPITKKKMKPNQDEASDSEVHLPKQETKIDKKKEMFRKMLQVESNRNTINVSGSKLRQRMLERLKAAQFRFLNEKLYTTSGSEAQKLFQTDPDAFHTYHQGYQQQLKKWPVNPLDLIVKRISKMPKTHIIADMGCGEAALSKRVPHSVRSFDLVASAPGVQACDMAHTPLLGASVDCAVYCLALMGTDLTQYLVEANRVLKVGGHLLIAEVESRFDKAETFTDGVQRLGFKLKNLDKSHEVFFFMEFTKTRDPPAKKSKLPALTLKPCLYKKR